MSLEDLRRQYTLDHLDESDVDPDPVDQFARWFEQIKRTERDSNFEVNAMSLATSDLKGNVSNRIVLLKGFDQNGFRFFTNYQSRKSEQLLQNPNAALLFFWPQLERQIRIEGKVERTSQSDSRKYFDARPRMSRISAVISPQSKVVTDRQFLEQKADEFAKKTGDGPIEIPEYWGGFLVKPYRFEFWQGRENRLHDRLQYRLNDHRWDIERLGP